MFDLKTVIQTNPACLQNRDKLKSVLNDMFPLERLSVNLVLISYDAGIAERLYNTTDVDDNLMAMLVSKLTDEYGIQEKHAYQAICLWANATEICISANLQNNKVIQDNLKPERIKHDPRAYQSQPIVGNATEYEVFVLDNDKVEIKKYLGFEEEVITIPNQINGKWVAGIGKGAYEDCKEIRSIIISNGIEYVEDNAFANCSNLTHVELPSTLQRIGTIDQKRGNTGFDMFLGILGSGAFYNCAIEHIDIPPSVTFLGKGTFSGCKRLKAIDLPNGIEKIPDDCFSSCESLESVIFPDDLMEIGRCAFNLCKSLSAVAFPYCLQRIGHRAFGLCTSLASIELNEGLHTIDPEAFIDCTSLITITIPKSVKSIDSTSFAISETDWIGKNMFTHKSPNKRITLYCYAGSYGIEYARRYGFSLKNAAK